MSEKKQKSVYHPKYWPIWLGIALGRVLVFLPRPLFLLLGRGIGRILLRYGKRMRHAAEVNIKLCFPELNEQEKTALVRKHFQALGISFVDILASWWYSDKKIRKITKLEGYEQVSKVVADGRAALLVGGHFLAGEMGSRLGSVYITSKEMNAIYEKAKNPLLEHMISGTREKYGAQLIPSTDLRRILRCLRKPASLWIAPDHNIPDKRSVFVPFFNVTTKTSTVVSWLAHASNAVVFPVSYYYLEGGKYVGKIHPPLENFPSGDDVKDARRINAFLEEMIRVCPEQYLWSYKRFKHRPEGEASFYKENHEL